MAKTGEMINGKWKSSPEYCSWQAMKRRCTDTKDKNYKYYGERGITIDPRWLSFDEFVKDMGPRLDCTLTIERIDNDKGYYKSNCKWGTKTEQSRNSRKCKLYRGKHVWEWAKELGITIRDFHNRLERFSRGILTEADVYRKDEYKFQSIPTTRNIIRLEI